MRIEIAGGSIAGCTAAYLMMKAGHDVTVFERSNKPLVGRGGGIGTTPTLIDQIRRDGLLCGDFAYFQINKNVPYRRRRNGCSSVYRLRCIQRV